MTPQPWGKGTQPVPYYRCSIHGTNFPGALIGVEGPVHFRATRWVQALHRRHARQRALAKLRRDPALVPPPTRRRHWFARPERADFTAAAVRIHDVRRIDRMPLRRTEALIFYRRDRNGESAFSPARHDRTR